MKEKPSEEKERAIGEVAGRLSPEDRLLWLVCRAELDPVRRRLLQETVNGTLAWDRVVDKGRYHRLLDLLHHHLHLGGCLGAVPAPQRARLDESRAEARRMQAKLDKALARSPPPSTRQWWNTYWSKVLRFRSSTPTMWCALRAIWTF